MSDLYHICTNDNGVHPEWTGTIYADWEWSDTAIDWDYIKTELKDGYRVALYTHGSASDLEICAAEIIAEIRSLYGDNFTILN